MGRPKKVEEEPLTDPEQMISVILHNYCAVPGCGPKFHEPEAHEIVILLKDYGYKIIKE